MSTMPIADRKNHGGIPVWPSETLASQIQNVANFALIVALVLGVLATFLVVWMGDVKERYLKKELADASALAVSAQSDSSKALEEQERLRNENLKLQQRILAQGHRNVLLLASQKEVIAALKPFPRQAFEMGYCRLTKFDPEVMETGMVLWGTLRQAEWAQKEDRDVGECTNGIVIRVRSTAPKSTQKVARLLAEELDKSLGKHAIGDLMVGQVGLVITEVAVPPAVEIEPSEPDTIWIEVQAHP